MLKGKNLQTRVLYPERISFTIEGEIKSFLDKQKLRVHHHETGLTRNVKGPSLSKKIKATTKNKYYVKVKTHW